MGDIIIRVERHADHFTVALIRDGSIVLTRFGGSKGGIARFETRPDCSIVVDGVALALDLAAEDRQGREETEPDEVEAYTDEEIRHFVLGHQLAHREHRVWGAGSRGPELVDEKDCAECGLLATIARMQAERAR